MDIKQLKTFVTAPQRKGKTLPMLAEVFRADLSFHLEENNSLSSIVCSPCGTKARNCTAMLSQIIASPAPQYRMRVSNTFTFCLLKANTWRLKNKSCNRNESKQYTNTRQIIEESNSTKQNADNGGNHADL